MGPNQQLSPNGCISLILEELSNEAILLLEDPLDSATLIKIQ